MPPIRLSDSELAAVMAAARPLPLQDRDRFLQDIAAELAALPMRGDGAVHRAIVTVQRQAEAGRMIEVESEDRWSGVSISL
jgi:hypothetical protein